MVTDTLVADRIEDGQRLLDRLAEMGIEVIAACWVKSSEDERWTFYLSTPLVDQRGPLAAYRDVLGGLRSLEVVWLTADDIVLIGEKHPITGDVLGILDRHSGMTLTRAKQPLLGGTPIQEVYVYLGSKRPAAHTELNEGERVLLETLYGRSPLAVDDLPYTAELESIHREFVQQTGLALTIRDVFKALKNLGRQGRLGGKLRAPAETNPAKADPVNTPSTKSA